MSKSHTPVALPAPKPVAVPPALPKPLGDPDAMRAMAAECKAAVTELLAGVQASTTAVGSMAFQGPAANVLSGVVGRGTHSVGRIAEDLSRFAEELLAGVAPLELQLKAWDDRNEYIKECEAYNRVLRGTSVAAIEFTDPPIRRGR